MKYCDAQKNHGTSRDILREAYSSPSENRSLVVLAGWLGCQPTSLEIYVTLYHDLGFETVLSKIATPAMVINSIFNLNTCSNKLPAHKAFNETSSMESLAWNVVQEVFQSNCSFFIFHAFSNAGYMLWEHVRKILSNTSWRSVDESNVHNQLGASLELSEIAASVNRRFAGLVLDSCPAGRIDKLPEAMRYTSWQERLDVLRFCGIDYRLLSSMPNILQGGQDTINALIDALQFSKTSYPLLFLFCNDDPLADAETIDAIIENRKRIVGLPIIFSKKW